MTRLAARFEPVFSEIAAGAIDRETGRVLPTEAMAALARAGFGAVRVPERHGGAGASLAELIELVMALGAADSNVAQAFRGHLLFAERLLVAAPRDRDTWLGRIAAGELVGNAQSERTAGTGISTTVTPDASGDDSGDLAWTLHGDKFYTTGTLYADWTWTLATDGEQSYGVLVDTRAPGVTVTDDWDGFGQRLTGSGSARFDQVRVPAGQVFPSADDTVLDKVDTRVFQHLYLLATLAGIGRAALRDATAFVQARTRVYGVAGKSEPRHDAAVQIVVGNIASLVYSAEALVRDVTRQLEAVRADAATVSGADPARTAVLVDDYAAVQVAQFSAQQIVIRNVLEATNQLFEVGGASALSTGRALDRHWRNARAIASHNPAILRQQAVGDFVLNGTLPANPS